jgi:signal transduction histidine kinase
MGTGMLVAFIFGSVVLYQIHTSLSSTLYRILEERTKTMAVSLSSHIERPIVTGDLFTVKRRLIRATETNPGLYYVIVEDRKNRIIVHTFQKSVPPDLVDLRLPYNPDSKTVEVFGSEKGRIFEAAVPILAGSAGRLRLGITDEMVTTEMSSLMWLLLLTLGFCMAIGLGLSLFLTYILTRPIQNLLLATNRISEGKFEFRAKVYSGDEIGKLATAFNRMAESLQMFRLEVEKKEAVRQALIEKIVLAQEEERASIARDLHDQLGQSLSVLLLEIQSMREGEQNPGDRYRELETRTYDLIDEVRRLAWGMHPSILDDYGLEHVLARYIEEISKPSKIKIDYQYICPPELGRLPVRTEATLYRIAQEAITNIVRHANANHASVILMRGKNETLLLIEDDGLGFDPESVDRDGLAHIGLIGMRERTTLLGADFTIESTLGNGTTIRVKIPQEEEQPCLSEL